MKKIFVITYSDKLGKDYLNKYNMKSMLEDNSHAHDRDRYLDGEIKFKVREKRGVK